MTTLQNISMKIPEKMFKTSYLNFLYSKTLVMVTALETSSQACSSVVQQYRAAHNGNTNKHIYV